VNALLYMMPIWWQAGRSKQWEVFAIWIKKMNTHFANGRHEPERRNR
jgi:hypothetical protein